MNWTQKIILTFVLSLAIGLIGGWWLFDWFHPRSLAPVLDLAPTTVFHDHQLKVELKLDSLYFLPRTKIYYTLDGSQPRPDNGQVYRRPLTYQAPAEETEIATVVIRAQAYYFGRPLSAEVNRTYFLSQKVNDRFRLPIVSLVVDPYYLWDHEAGILVEGKQWADFIAANPDYESDPKTYYPTNYNQRGRLSERPVDFSYVDNGQVLFQQTAGLRVQGGFSRRNHQKSFRLIARRDYSPTHAHFNYQFFPDLAAPQDPSFQLDQFDELVLRAANDNQTFIRDELGSALARQLDFPHSQPHQFVSTYLNGFYYGLGALKPNADSTNLRPAYQIGIDDDYQIVSVIDEGRGYPYHDPQLLDFYGLPYDRHPDPELSTLITSDLTVDDNYYQLAQIVDLDNLLFYYALELALNNTDWPGNNVKLWRYQGEPIPNTDLDGRWRFLLFDLDQTFDFIMDQSQIVNYVLGEQTEKVPNTNLGYLLARPELAQQFIFDVQLITQTVLTPENLTLTIKNISSDLNFEIEQAIMAGTYEDFRNENWVDFNRQQIPMTAVGQNQYLIDFLQNYFQLPENKLRLQLDEPTGGQLTVQNYAVPTTLFADGALELELFVAQPLAVSAQAFPGYEFSHWLVNEQLVSDAQLSLTAADLSNSDQLHLTAVFTTILQSQPLQIGELYNYQHLDWLEFYNPNADQIINLADYCLSDRDDFACRWQFPVLTLAPQEYLVVYSQDNNSLAAHRQLYFNFNLGRHETLTLINTQTNQIEQQLIVPVHQSEQSFSFDHQQNRYRLTSFPTPNFPNQF